MSVFEEEVIVLCSGAGHFTLLAQLVINLLGSLLCEKF